MVALRPTLSWLHQGSDPRVFWIKNVWAAGLLAGFLLSPRLWVATRTYPLSPVAEWLPAIVHPVDVIWFGVLLGLLVVVLIWPRPRWPLAAFAVLAGLLCLLDQSRWQPWFYQYLFLGIALACYPWDNPDEERGAAALHACRLIVAGTYFWSGVQKLNWTFLHLVFPWLIEPLIGGLSADLRQALNAAAFLTPVLEAGIGLGLLTRRLRTVAVVAACLMHGLILLCIGPWAWNWNSVVWPWNAALPLLTALLFLRTEEITLAGIVRPRRAIQAVALLLFGVMPAFDFVGWWDSYLSAALYSSNTLDARIYLLPPAVDRLPLAWRGRAMPQGDGTFYVSPLEWSLAELNVPPYPARRVYRSMARQFLPFTVHPDEVLLDIVERPDPWTGQRRITQYLGQDIETGAGQPLPAEPRP